MDPTLFPFVDPMSGGAFSGAGVSRPDFPLPSVPSVGPTLGAVPAGGGYAPAYLPENPNVGRLSGPAMDSALTGALYVPPSQTQGSVGGNVGGIGSDYAASGGQGIGEERPGSATSTSGRGAPLSTALQGALRGVQAGAPPQAQTVRTPPPLQPRPIQGGELVSMLTSLGITPQEFVRMGGLKLRG
jgi:hypothetical protein